MLLIGFGIVFAIISILLICIYHFAFKNEEKLFLGISVITGILSVVCITFYCTLPHHGYTPARSDVFKGNARYVETIHITEGDTVKTYEIEWND